jgi:hypothetical protein
LRTRRFLLSSIFCTWTLQCTWFYQWKFACPKVLETIFRSYICYLFQVCFKSTLTMERSTIGLSSSTINMMGLFKKASLVKFCILLVKNYLKNCNQQGVWMEPLITFKFKMWMAFSKLKQNYNLSPKKMQMKHVPSNLNSWTLRV